MSSTATSSPSDNIISKITNIFNYLRSEHPKKSALFTFLFLRFLYNKFATVKKNVRDKVILITGAGSGLGKNMAGRFAALGARVVLWDINQKAVETCGKEIAENGGRAWSYACDVTNKENVYSVAERVKTDVGNVDILINNAGIVSGNLIEEVSDQKIERTFQVNVLSHFWTIKSFLPNMIARNSGHIVTIASAAGLGGAPKLTDYCASKFAAVGLSESLRRELSRRGATGVASTCVCPFYINTGMFTGAKTRFSLLLPILEEDYACKKIIYAILTEQEELIMPNILKLNNLLRFLLPVTWMDSLSRFLGIDASMDDFKGRQNVN